MNPLNKKEMVHFSLAVGSVIYFQLLLFLTWLTFSHQPGQAKVIQRQNLSMSLYVLYLVVV
jgi:hypothetical protein